MSDLPPEPPTPEPVPADDRLTTMGLFVESYNGVRAQVEADLEHGGLTGSEFEVLIRLARSPGRRLRMSALARQTIVTSSGLTRLVDRLSAAGLVARVRDDHDRRVYYAELTPPGHETLQRVLPNHLEVLDRLLLSVLDDDEHAAFVNALRKIRAVANPGADPATEPPADADPEGGPPPA